MKKTVLQNFIILCSLLIIGNIAFAQGSFTSTWALTADASSATVGANTTVVTSNMLIGSSFTGGSYSTSGFGCKSSTTWPNAVTAGYYLDFPISSAAGFDIELDSFALVPKTSGSSGNNILSFAYIIDTAAPVLITGGQVTATAGGTTTIKMTAYGAPVTCTAGHTLKIRMWAYSASASTTTSRTLYIKSVQFAGKTTPAIVPVAFSAISVNKYNTGNAIHWSVAELTNVQSYQIEKSIDGINFNVFATLLSNKGQNSYSVIDNYTNDKTAYYRVAAIATNGDKKYSKILNIKNVFTVANIKIAPNPITNKQFELQIADCSKGQYKLSVYNQLGAVVYSRAIQVDGDYQLQTIQLPTSLAKGVYFANFNGVDVNNNQTLIVE
ncbi:MAG: T9SS type A sorting domain-containing protein [Bacteroidota bacterium]